MAPEQHPSRLRYRSKTVTTFVSEPDALAASVTVTLIVKLFGKITTYVCPLVNEPSLDTVPVDVVPSPQLILYDHGPLWLASVKLQCRLYSTPVNAVSSGPAFTTGGALQFTEYGTVVVAPAITVAVREGPPLTVQFEATERKTVWSPAESAVYVTLPVLAIVLFWLPSTVTV